MGQNIPPGNCALWISKTEIAKPPNVFTDSGKVRGIALYIEIEYTYIWKTRKASYQHKFIHRKTKFFFSLLWKKVQKLGWTFLLWNKKTSNPLGYLYKHLRFQIHDLVCYSVWCMSQWLFLFHIFKNMGLFTFLV